MTEHGIHRGKLVGALGFLGLAAYSFYGMIFDGGPAEIGPDPEILDPSLDEVEDVEADALEDAGRLGSASTRGQKARVIRADLLAAHGTYESGLDRSPFRSSLVVPAMATLSDSAAVGSTEWRPPTLTVSMIFRAKGVERASVDGAVVGVGDALAGGTVRRIVRQGLELELDGTLLFYELQSPYPRGYAPPVVEDELAEEALDPAADDPAFADPEEEKE